MKKIFVKILAVLITITIPIWIVPVVLWEVFWGNVKWLEEELFNKNDK